MLNLQILWPWSPQQRPPYTGSVAYEINYSLRNAAYLLQHPSKTKVFTMTCLNLTEKDGPYLLQILKQTHCEECRLNFTGNIDPVCISQLTEGPQ